MDDNPTIDGQRWRIFTETLISTKYLHLTVSLVNGSHKLPSG